MKIRDRLPFRQVHNTPATAEVVTDQPVQDPTEGEVVEHPQHADGPANGLAGAFDVVARAVGQEIEGLRDSVGGLEAKLMARLDVDKRETREAVETIRKDVVHRIEEMRQSQQKTLNEITEKTKAAVASLRDLVDRTREHVNERSEEVREGLEQILAQKEQRIAKELDALSSNLAGVRLDLQNQIQSSGQVSNLLENVATVFAGQQNLKSQPQPNEHPDEDR
jgi:ATP-dependent Lon protease